ncbi:C-reactive protein [Galemys pyrenaicus]|uniref:C-reactive protein n=1 Tax=Galemys pyrenaicus TaxID=202257 RepID=A0A8J6A3H6_GALPY|nr:C-reactive protein [Galemys pyrenaicus]
MEKLVHWFLVFTGFSSAFGQISRCYPRLCQRSDLDNGFVSSLYHTSHLYVFCLTDMHKKAFVLPKESDNSFVTLTAQLKKPLTAFTVCLYTYTDVSRDYSLFSYATRKQPNEILLYWSKTRGYVFGVGGDEVIFPSPEVTATPVHVCASWESASGIAELWVDGKPKVRRSLKKGFSVGTEAIIVLGQEQDSFGGGFDKNQSLVGDIGDVNMWDSVLSPEQISTLYAGGPVSPNVLNWQALKYEAHGEVFTRAQLWPEALS